jgi:hypothetical protein
VNVNTLPATLPVTNDAFTLVSTDELKGIKSTPCILVPLPDIVIPPPKPVN